VDVNASELVSISVIACLGLVMAWAQAADLFAICFATAAAIASFEAARRSISLRVAVKPALGVGFEHPVCAASDAAAASISRIISAAICPSRCPSVNARNARRS
jgi:hypothetical protein